MIPQVAKRGTSFKGAGLYYLHDKRKEGETSRSTRERIEWTQTRNIMSEDPDFALRLMAATAMDKDRLKEQAGISNAGRKSKGEVYAYSLAWHPDEQGKITKVDMLMAADQSLKALGAQNHQAVIVAHNDADHPHIHVILNMVNPENGKNMAVSNDRKKLHKWSNDYRKMRGEEHKYCPKKAAKFEAIEAKMQGQSVKYVKGENIPRQYINEAKISNDNKQPLQRSDYKKLQTKIFKSETVAVTVDGKPKNLNLSEYGEYQAAKHHSEKQYLYEKYQEKTRNINKSHILEEARSVEAIKAQMELAHREAYRQHDNDYFYWQERDKSLIGKLQNAIETVKFTRAIGRSENNNFITSLYSALSNVGARSNTLDRRLEENLAALRREERGQVTAAKGLLEKIKTDRLASAREAFLKDETRLDHKQAMERKELRVRWTVYAAKKRTAFKALAAKARIAGQDEKLLAKDRTLTAKESFAKNKPEERSRRKRSRKRKNGDT